MFPPLDLSCISAARVRIHDKHTWWNRCAYRNAAGGKKDRENSRSKQVGESQEGKVEITNQRCNAARGRAKGGIVPVASVLGIFLSISGRKMTPMTPFTCSDPKH